MGNTLKRSEYWDHDLYIPRVGATGNAQSYTDVQRYLLPMDQVRNTACLTWGVAAGLTVQAAPGPGGVRVSPGAAIDAEGRLIVLRPGGAAVVDPAADPDQIDDIPAVAVADDGVVLGTVKVTGDYLLTVTWLEVLQRESPEDPPVLVHAPWMRLIRAKDFHDGGRQVVLAQLTLDDGNITALSAGMRRLVGLPTGRLELRAVTETGGGDLQVGQRVMAEFAADPKGDATLTVTSGGSPRRSLSVEGATGNVSVHTTLFARGDADFTGKLTTRATIEATGGMNVGGFLNVLDTLNAHNVLNALGGLNVQGTLHAQSLLKADAGLIVRGALEASPGIWCYQDAPNASRAFIGMANNDLVGIWSKPMQNWLLSVNIKTGETGFSAGKVSLAGRLEVTGTLNALGPMYVEGPFYTHDSLDAMAGLSVRGNLDVRGLKAHYECHDFTIYGAGLNSQVCLDYTNLKVVGSSSLEGGCKIYGSLSKPGGMFLIDHPLDPTGKYLSHSFVESPEMLNVYSGVAVTDDHGEVTVTLPDFFEALNRDHRFQVTPIGRLALAAVDGGVRENTFTIRTDQPNVTVSWQVTGVRQDPWALANPIEVEREKPEEERGLLLYPETYGYPVTMGINNRAEAEEKEDRPDGSVARTAGGADQK
ncbi:MULTISPECIES: hypothetical protein [unclassified Nonomuraea]|uniref:hypothetical protein n=1 Tax=unclassified Nonomuraea TaxID=2593643 RepID=UPI0033E7FD52